MKVELIFGVNKGEESIIIMWIWKKWKAIRCNYQDKIDLLSKSNILIQEILQKQKVSILNLFLIYETIIIKFIYINH